MQPTIFLVLLTTLWNPAAEAMLRPVTKTELADKLAYYRSIQVLHTKFHETKTLKGMNIKIKSDGNLTVQRPNKVIWEVVQPSPITVILDNQNVKILDGSGKTETYQMDGGAKESLKPLVAWMRLDPEELALNYDVFAMSDNRYRFQPKETAKSPFLALQMTLKANSYVEKLEIEETSGDHLEIRFEKPRIERSHDK